MCTQQAKGTISTLYIFSLDTTKRKSANLLAKYLNNRVFDGLRILLERFLSMLKTTVIAGREPFAWILPQYSLTMEGHDNRAKEMEQVDQWKSWYGFNWTVHVIPLFQIYIYIYIAQQDYDMYMKSPFTFLERLGINFNNIYFVFLAMSSRNACPTHPAPSEPVSLRRSVAWTMGE